MSAVAHPVDSTASSTGSLLASRGGGSQRPLLFAAAAMLVAGLVTMYDAVPAAHADAAGVTTASALQSAFAVGGDVTLGADITMTPDDGPLAVGAGRTVTLDLAGYTLEVTAPSGAAGVGAPVGTALAITDTGGDGRLTAQGGDRGAGIGGGNEVAGGTITIEGGTVSATSGFHAAGIGGGFEASSGDITISGGTVAAVATSFAGGEGGAGIGGGFEADSDTIIISGGTVIAQAANFAAGIGGGSRGSGGIVTISGGTVTAHGGYEGAGIGSGRGEAGKTFHGADLTIGASATVTVTAESWMAIDGYDTFGTVTNNGTLVLSDLTNSWIRIPAGATLTNNGAILGNGVIDGDGTIVNNGSVAPGISGTEDGLHVTGHHYRLHFDANGASGVTGAMPEDMTVLGRYVTAPLPGNDAFWKDGCRFVGWYPSPSDTTTPLSAVDLSAGGTKLSTDGAPVVVTAYAGYDCTPAPTHTVTFDSRGGTDVASKNVVENFVLAKPANPFYDGYTFMGWYTEATGGTAWNFAYGVPEDMTLYAHWTFTGYRVTFDAQGGSYVPSQTVLATAAVPALPWKDGYTLVGWFDAAEGGTEWDFATPVTSSMTLHAHWTFTGFTITFDAMGGAPATQTVTAGDGALVPRPTTTPTKDHALFDGWYTSSGSSWNFDDGVATSSMTLYAHWWTYAFTATFVADGAEYVHPPIHVESGRELGTPGYNPTLDGYTFAGWYTAATGGSPWVFDTVLTKDVTLYAHWTATTSGSSSSSSSSSTSSGSSSSTVSSSSTPSGGSTTSSTSASTPTSGSPTTTSTAPRTTSPAAPAPVTTSVAAPTSSTGSTASRTTGPAPTTFSSSTPPPPVALPPDADAGSPGLDLGDPTPHAGEPLDLSADGFEPGSTVDFWLNSDPVYLGSAIADASGVARLTVTLGAAVTGEHHLQAVGTAVDGAVRNLAQPITITAALASTGVDAAEQLALGLLLLIGGAFLLLAARRRRGIQRP